MTKTLWVKLSVDYMDDPKIVGAGADAELLFVRGLAYAKKNNNPVIPAVMLPRLCLGMNVTGSDVADRLVTTSLWAVEDNGYRIVAWDAWQVNETNKGQSAGGTLAMHNRWHKTTRSSTCAHCQDGATDDRLEVLATEPPKPKEALAYPEQAHTMCNLLAEFMVRNGAKKPTITDLWLADMERLNRIDGRAWDDIERIITWCQQDSFWRTNILSPTKLRKQFDQLVLKSSSPVKGVSSDAERAWADVQEQVRKVGSHGLPSFATIRTRNTVRKVGWRTICQSTQFEIMKGQFVRAYTEATDDE